eukprot:PhM_4_TR10357/c6_g1_i2/m.80272
MLPRPTLATFFLPPPTEDQLAVMHQQHHARCAPFWLSQYNQCVDTLRSMTTRVCDIPIDPEIVGAVIIGIIRNRGHLMTEDVADFGGIRENFLDMTVDELKPFLDALPAEPRRTYAWSRTDGSRFVKCVWRSMMGMNTEASQKARKKKATASGTSASASASPAPASAPAPASVRASASVSSAASRPAKRPRDGMRSCTMGTPATQQLIVFGQEEEELQD